MEGSGNRRSIAFERDSESGQASIFLVLLLGTFLLAMLAFSIDLTNLWFQRQAAQTAADAACQAGAMDMLKASAGNAPSKMGFAVPTSGQTGGGDCGSSSDATMCTYARYNGFDGSGGQTANTVPASVSWTFPSSVAGVTAPTVSTATFLKVVVQQNVKTWFMGLLGKTSQTVGASCTCGLMQAASRASSPIVVLNPTVQGALNISGGAIIKIAGGPQQSIQINSSYAGNCSGQYSCSSAFSCSGSGQIDTSTAGPNGTGGDVDITGGPSSGTDWHCGGSSPWDGGTTGHWTAAAPLPDPFGSVVSPTQPADAPAPLWVPYGMDGCPNNGVGIWLTDGSGDPRTPASMKNPNTYKACMEFFPGYYPNGIDFSVQSRGAPSSYSAAIFAPGIYYMNGSLTASSSMTIRNAWPHTPPSTDGVLFYFLRGGPSFSGCTGCTTASMDPVPNSYLGCRPNSTTGSLNGNVLVAQCTSSGTYVGQGSSDTFSSTGGRGILMFGDHNNVISANNPSTFTGSGTLNFVGSLYFHNKNGGDVLTFSGAGGSNTLVLGAIISDQIQLTGSGKITMNVAPGSTSSGVTKVGLFQ